MFKQFPFTQPHHFPWLCRAAVMLFALAWSSIAFCDEIFDAVCKDDLKKANALLKANPNLVFSHWGGDGWTPLFYPVDLAHKAMAELLLSYGADVNAKDVHGWTLLHCAAMGNRKEIEMTKLLLAHGTDVDARDNHGATPLDMAAVTGHADIASLLLANKANVNARDMNSQTPLHFASSAGVAQVLLANKAQVNARDNEGWTPLHHAATIGFEDVVKVLLANKAEVNSRDHDGRTPLGEAIHYKKDDVADFKDVTNLLRQHDAHE